MFTIGIPEIVRYGEKSRLKCEVKNGDTNSDHIIWYEVENEYSTYLCDELADSFLLAVLPFASYTEQDIVVKGTISSKLFYNLMNVHIPLLANFFNKKAIHITVDNIRNINFGGKAVATGCFLGVDSLSTIFQHTDALCLEEYKLTHLTLFNSSHFGNSDQATLSENLQNAAKKASEFAKQLGLSLIVVDSNMTELMKNTGLRVEQILIYLTISCAYSLQKLFGKYLFSSSYDSKYVSINSADISHSESIIVPLLSSDSMEVILSDTFKKRTEKTLYIARNRMTPQFIDVCWAVQVAGIEGGAKWYLESKKKRNCGWCDKCMRTLLTLELYGVIDEYKDAFDLDNYYKHRSMFIRKVVARSPYNIFYQELYDLMKQKSMRIPLSGVLLRKFDVRNNRLIRSVYHLIEYGKL